MSGLKKANFVDTVLQDLLHRDLIVKCNKQPFLVNSLTVLSNPTQRKDWLLILELSMNIYGSKV